MLGQVGRCCSDLDQKLRLLASSPELPSGASVVMVWWKAEFFTFCYSQTIVSNTIPYFTKTKRVYGTRGTYGTYGRSIWYCYPSLDKLCCADFVTSVRRGRKTEGR